MPNPKFIPSSVVVVDVVVVDVVVVVVVLVEVVVVVVLEPEDGMTVTPPKNWPGSDASRLECGGIEVVASSCEHPM